MRLHFDASRLIHLLQHSEQSEERTAMHGQTSAPDVPVGLWLVGDDGIYFTSNGCPPLLTADGSEQLVAYAEEADPERHPETFYEVKEAAFGGDDGIRFVSRNAAMIIIAYSRDNRACINLTPTSLGAMAPAAAAGRASKGGRR